MILREARRFFRKNLLLSLSGISVLALGLGASTLILSLLLVFSSLSYPGMRAMGYATIAEEAESGGSMPITWQKVERLCNASTQPVSLAAYSEPIGAKLKVQGGSRSIALAAVSSGFFSAFTSRLFTGREFDREEEGQTNRHVIILSYAFAVALFKRPESALDKSIEINGLSYRVIGVAPVDFQGVFGESVSAWVPASNVVPLILSAPPGPLIAPDVWKSMAAFYVVAASKYASSTELATYLTHTLPIRVATETSLHVSQGLTEDPVREVRIRKWLRLGFLLAALFTVISSSNYSLLLLARTPQYMEEVRLKKALGARGGRLMIELVIGPAVMVGVGLLIATALWVGSLIAISNVPGIYGQLVRGSWHAALLAFGIQCLLAFGLTLLIALIPVFSFLRDDGAPRLGYSSTADRRTNFLLQVPVTFEIAVCIGVWILTSMIIGSLMSLISTPLGYDPAHLKVICIGPSSDNVSFTVGSNGSFPSLSSIESLLGQMSTIPGVRGASYASGVPFDQPLGTISVERLDGHSPILRTVNEMTISRGYFDTMKTLIIRGKDFSAHGGVDEIIINKSLAKELWPNDSPINRSVKIIIPTFAGLKSFTHVATIVGEVEDMRTSGFTESPKPTIFSSLYGNAFFDINPHFVIDGSESSRLLTNVASPIVTTQMPGLRVQYVYSVGDRAQGALWKEKERAYFVLAGALVMALVACIGFYGALTYYVSTKRRDLAVRICLGAQPWAIRRIILTRAARCAIWATVLSLPLWPVLSRLSSNDFVGRVSWSTGRAIFISLACVSVSMIISFVPAMAAADISPSEVLKEQ